MDSAISRSRWVQNAASTASRHTGFPTIIESDVAASLRGSEEGMSWNYIGVGGDRYIMRKRKYLRGEREIMRMRKYLRGYM